MPLTGFKFPSNDSSPIKQHLSLSLILIWLLTLNIAIAIGKSYKAPSFFKSAGERFIIIFFMGKLYPLLIIAAFTLCLDSFIALSGKPTIVKEGRPLEICASTEMVIASMPTSAKLVSSKNIC